MSNALQTREPSMDEILASIRRIIEGGDELGTARLDPVEHMQALHVSESDGQGSDDDLDLKARAFSEGSSESKDGLPLWPEGPGEPANDRTAMVAHLKRETEAMATDSDQGEGKVPSRKSDSDDNEIAALASVEATDQANAATSAAVADDMDFMSALSLEIEGEGSAQVSPTIQAARQSAQSMAARTERLIAVVGGMQADAEADDDGEAVSDTTSAPSPAMDDGAIANTDILELLDERSKATGDLQDSLRNLRADAFGESGLEGIAAKSPEAPAVDAFAEFDEDEFANELLERADMLDAVTSPTKIDIADRDAESVAATNAMNVAKNVDRHADDGGRGHFGSSWTGEPLNSHIDAAIHHLISDEASQRVSASFTDLSIAIRDEQMRSIDDTVRTMLQPMLQEWLDDNLPHMVERLVREEIERVARGGRR